MMRQIMLAAGLLYSLLGDAQNSWGLQSGISFDRLNGDGMSPGLNSGFQAGAYARIRIIKKLSIQPQFLFTRRNATVSDNFTDLFPATGRDDFDKSISTNYLAIPILLSYRIGQRVFFNVGPEFLFLVDSYDRLSNGSHGALASQDITLVSGLEYQLRTFKFFGQYSYGLSNVNNLENHFHPWQSRGLQLGVGWRISR